MLHSIPVTAVRHSDISRPNTHTVCLQASSECPYPHIRLADVITFNASEDKLQHIFITTECALGEKYTMYIRFTKGVFSAHVRKKIIAYIIEEYKKQNGVVK